jgi:hypothetical protein
MWHLGVVDLRPAELTQNKGYADLASPIWNVSGSLLLKDMPELGDLHAERTNSGLHYQISSGSEARAVSAGNSVRLQGWVKLQTQTCYCDIMLISTPQASF